MLNLFLTIMAAGNCSRLSTICLGVGKDPEAWWFGLGGNPVSTLCTPRTLYNTSVVSSDWSHWYVPLHRLKRGVELVEICNCTPQCGGSVASAFFLQPSVHLSKANIFLPFFLMRRHLATLIKNKKCYPARALDCVGVYRSPDGGGVGGKVERAFCSRTSGFFFNNRPLYAPDVAVTIVSHLRAGLFFFFPNVVVAVAAEASHRSANGFHCAPCCATRRLCRCHTTVVCISMTGGVNFSFEHRWWLRWVKRAIW